VQDVVRHLGDRRLHGVGLVRHRFAQELADQRVDRPVERGREEKALAAARRATEDPADGRQETEVGHVVGLVEDGDLDVVEGTMTLADQVLEPAGAGDDDVHAAAEGVDLWLLADAAEDGPGGESGLAREGRECGVDLSDQLTGRREDQRSRGAASSRRPSGEAGHQGK
jgi:hypothetical protein